jgi:hypothetical protein
MNGPLTVPDHQSLIALSTALCFGRSPRAITGFLMQIVRIFCVIAGTAADGCMA